MADTSLAIGPGKGRGYGLLLMTQKKGYQKCPRKGRAMGYGYPNGVEGMLIGAMGARGVKGEGF